MSRTAIRVDRIGKQYQIGRTAERYPTLRDALVRGVARGANAVSALSRGRAWGTAPELFWALRDVSLEIAEGDIVGMIGRNGAGKSTLLKVLARVTEPTEGSAQLRGRIGSLLEVGTGFHPELTGRENTFLNGAILGMRRAEIARKFDEIVAFAEVEQFIDTPVKHYSSGMYLRLAFAVAAHLEPEILLVDEVLAVGDAAFQRKCIGKMSEVSQHGRTVIFVSHNMDAVQRLCPRSVLLESGRVAMYSDTASVVARYFASSSERPAPGSHIDLSAAPRRGSGEARFTEASFQGAGAGATPIQSEGPLTVTATIESDEPRTIESVAVSIRTRSGTKLVNADSIALGRAIHLRAGRTRVRLHMRTLHLNPGVYVAALWMSRAAGPPIDYLDSAFELEVVRTQDTAFGLAPTWDGVVTCDFQITDE